MGFLNKIFGTKEAAIGSNDEFWKWFGKNAKQFHNVVKRHDNIEQEFFSRLSPKLSELREGYFYLTGMLDENTAELIFTADGTIKNFVFVEELVASAPDIPGWKFTAHKPETKDSATSIKMGDYRFSTDTLNFYAEERADHPDEIEIVVTHDDLNNENRDSIANGIYIFLDTYLGDLKFATSIDNLRIIQKSEARQELIPLEKLKAFLNWREKEFVEKYDSVLIKIQEDEFSLMEGHKKNGKPIIAAIDMELLKWENKASHPWMLKMEVFFDGSKNDGLPDTSTFQALNSIEDELLLALKDHKGYLYLGRETSEDVRDIYIACKEFRNCSKIADQIKQKYKYSFDIAYEIYKDKYWQSLAHFA
ncbi:DUF695 domain-containing protein [Pedobacter ginsengisoli]|uniref:DUF695 domain-containing protein n=1 Tax=Pedobacter ginsengisoli TaxID=363852 RepID=UPI00254E0514|nr:DUF695 domain-containing protein [Pedobacter ginsengisoli]